MMEIFGAVLTSVLGGGATGLLGVLLQRWFDQRKAQADLRLVELQLAAAERTRRLELEHQAAMADRVEATKALEAQLALQAREIDADAAAYAASMGADRATYLAPEAQAGSRWARAAMALVDLVRGLVRPGITAYSLALLTMVFWWVQDLYRRAGAPMTAEQLHQLAMQCLGTVFYLSTTCVVWWFGVRPGQPPRGR